MNLAKDTREAVGVFSSDCGAAATSCPAAAEVLAGLQLRANTAVCRVLHRTPDAFAGRLQAVDADRKHSILDDSLRSSLELPRYKIAVSHAVRVLRACLRFFRGYHTFVARGVQPQRTIFVHGVPRRRRFEYPCRRQASVCLGTQVRQHSNNIRGRSYKWLSPCCARCPLTNLALLFFRIAEVEQQCHWVFFSASVRDTVSTYHARAACHT